MQNNSIAIIGMACRFPGADSIEEFWNNLCNGVDSVQTLSDEELKKAGVNDALLQDPNFIKKAGKMTGAQDFDAAFFGYSPAEAQVIDPQQRVFLEVAWTALEHAGYGPTQFNTPVGVFAGSGPNKYFLYHLFGKKFAALEDHQWDIDDFPIGTNPDALSARVSYKLSLNGPSISVQTACSTSLVSVALACESLLDFRCDVAIAGGVAIQLPSQMGYLYQEGGMLSKTGCCFPFDARADGSVFSSGAGVVVLKRLEDAQKDCDTIYGVIRGWAVRNDGSKRAGYTTPGVEGQANVVVEAQVAAGLEPEDICYIETHGSATPVGDPIEIASLTRAFNRGNNSKTGYCAVGSVKSNLGHLDVAAGIAGLIKTTLMLKNRRLCKSLHFEKENPAINFNETPFFVQKDTVPLDNAKPLYAGVSSFGLGGTNAHIILEAPHSIESQSELITTGFSVLPISGKSTQACESLTQSILKAIAKNANSRFIENAAYTLSMGRTHFVERGAIIVSRDGTQNKILKGRAEKLAQDIVFMFPGVGDQFQNSFRELYEQPGVFRVEMQRVAQAFTKYLNTNLLDYLYASEETNTTDKKITSETIDLKRMLGRVQEDSNLQRTTLAQSACFALEYALAKQMMTWGITPSALIGHSIGEYVAACLAEVMSFEDAIALVATRAAAIESLPCGSMLAVPLTAQEIAPFLDKTFIAAKNGPKLCVVSGTKEDIDNLHHNLETAGIMSQKIRATHPFHSELLRPAALKLQEITSKIQFAAPKIPYLSNLTGTWITEADVKSVEYWSDHLCKTVQFEAGIRTLCSIKDLGFCLELGPGQTLSAYAREIAAELKPELKIIHTGPSYYESLSTMGLLMEALAKIWIWGGAVCWEKFYANKNLQRIALPTYPFESKRYWIEKNASLLSNNMPIGVLAEPGSHQQHALQTTIIQDDFHGGEERPNLAVSYLAPRNELEEKLEHIWKGLFGYRKIGVNDDFVALGGHSLLALQFANKFWRLHKVEVPLAILLTHSTIAKLAEYLKPKFKQSDNQSDQSAVLALDSTNNNITATIFENYLLKYFSQSKKQNITLDSVLQENEIAAVVPELIRALRRDFDFRLYPNEVMGFKLIREFAEYLTNELVKPQKKSDASNVLSATHYTDPRPVVFILSSVRAGSTLLRVMLAGHPQLFAPPEFHLLGYDTMQQRAQLDKAPDKNQGIERALVEAFQIDLAEAQQQIQDMINRDLRTAEVVSQIAAAVAPRLLIDKSPGNANDIRSLFRIKNAFPNAKFIYLYRHPYTVIDSVVKNRFVKLMEGGATDPYDFGEFIWTRSNSNILDFIESLNPQDYFHLKYEELVTSPAQIMQNLANFLGISYSESLIKPYSGRRMRDGLGDPNFLDHDSIDASLAEIWRTIKLPRNLSRSSRAIAQQLNYEILI